MHLIRQLREQKVQELVSSFGNTPEADAKLRGYIYGLDELLNIQFEEIE